MSMHPTAAAAFLACAKSHLKNIEAGIAYEGSDEELAYYLDERAENLATFRGSGRELADLLDEDHRHMSRAANSGGTLDATLARWQTAWKEEGFPELVLQARAGRWTAHLAPEAELWAEVLGARERPWRHSLHTGLPVWRLTSEDGRVKVYAAPVRLINNLPGVGPDLGWSYDNLRSEPWRRLREAKGLDLQDAAATVGLDPTQLVAIEDERKTAPPGVLRKLLDLYTPEEGQRATLRPKQSNLVYDVRYLRGEYTYWRTNTDDGSVSDIESEKTRRHLRLALSMDDPRPLEKPLEGLSQVAR